MDTNKMSESTEKDEKDVTTFAEAAAVEKETAATESDVVKENAPEGDKDKQVEVAAEQTTENAGSFSAMSKPELVQALEKLSAEPIDTIKDKVAQIKATFFALRKEEIAKEKEAFLAAGNEESAFAVRDDADEARIKELLNELKDKRAQYNAEQEAIKADNLAKKRAIIAEIENISNDADNINRQFNHVQQLQQDFKAIGEVPATESSKLWKDYQVTVERFYDLLKINKELRDYDFKKNLEIKQQLCAEAEALDDENEVVAAFKKLQELHDTWRETGPVAKDLREDLWLRFKNASSVINKKYQDYFENRKEQEKNNAEAKLALCEKIEALKPDEFKTYAAWDKATNQIIELQAEWKKIGFAARKLNSELFARFRKSCDEFFAKKAEFFKEMKDQLAANLAKKTELCEKAEALKDSTDWKKTTDALVELQKEWKTVGPVVKKHSEAVWKRFIAACDHFFEEKKKQSTNIHVVEHENLKQKKEVVAAIKTALENETPENGAKVVRELMAKWQTIGHVPYKEKDKIYGEYKEAIDEAFDKFDMKSIKANLSNFETSINSMSGSDKVMHERERLVRGYEQKCNELKVLENNLGFFNARSKTGNSIVKEVERKIAKIKDEISLLEKKIKMIDEKL